MKFFKNSIEKVFDIFSHIEDMFAIIDIDNGEEKFSSNFYDFFDINHNNISFSKLKKYIDDEDFIKLSSQIKNNFQDIKIKTKDGRKLLCSSKLLNFNNRKYALIFFETSEKFDTEEKKLKEKIEKQEKEKAEKKLNSYIFTQKHLLSLLPTAIAVYESNRKLKYCNRSFISMWDLDEKWISENPTYGEILEKLREKRLLPEQSNFQEFKKNQMKLFSEVREAQEDFLYLPNGRAIRVALIPTTDGKLIFAYDDLTEKLNLESSYNTLIAVQRETLDNLREGVAVFGENGRIKLFNKSFINIWDFPKEILEKKPHFSEILDYLKPKYKYEGSWEDYKEERIRIMLSRKFESLRIERKDGRIIDFLIIPLPDGDSICYYSDVTDSVIVERTLREKNKALEEADKLKTDFLENISYELRSPLTSIMGFSEILSHDYLGKLNKKQKEYVENILSASNKLNYLIDNILNLASIEAGYLELEIQDIEIKKLINSVVSEMQKDAEEKEISIELELNKEISKISGDENRIRQSLVHLITNAINFTKSKGTITIGLDKKVTHEEKDLDENFVLLWVQDSGVGIPKEAQKAVFERFYKVDVGKGGNSGVGIGLSLVKRIINLHGGDIELESEKGKGTKIICSIPQSITVSKNIKEFSKKLAAANQE